MTGTSHQLFAVLAAVWLFTLYPTDITLGMSIMALIAVMVGALTPDLDQPTANVWRRLLGGRAVGEIFQAFSGGHRHFTHSLIGIFLIGFLTRYLITKIVHPEVVPQAMFLWTAYMIGYISHPIADSLTDRGVPWFWPININLKFPPGPEELRVTTGSFVETFIVRPALIVAIGLIISGQWALIKTTLLG